MNAEAFFDSNVLIYLVSEDTVKAEASQALLAGGGVISIQVLNEFAWVSRRKYRNSISEIRRALAGIRALCDIKILDLQTHELGLDIAERYRFPVFDSMLVASALLAGCKTLYTEDLQNGQRIDGLAVRNPFTA